MAHHKRKRPKSRRGFHCGCCHQWKHNAYKDSNTMRTRSQVREDDKRDDQLKQLV